MSSKVDGTDGATKSTKLGLVGSASSPGHVTGNIDERFERSMAALSLQLAARFTKDSPANEMGPAGDAHHAADLPPENREVDQEEQVPRGRTLTMVLTLGFAAAAACGLYFLQGMAPRSSPPPPTAIATIPTPPPVIVDSAPEAQPSLPPPPSSSAITDPAPATQLPVMETARAASVEPEPVAATPDKASLGLYGILEVQARLKSLGMAPGPLDGVAGPLTAAAVRRYEASKGKPQTGNIDGEILKRLREDTSRPGPQAQILKTTRP